MLLAQNFHVGGRGGVVAMLAMLGLLGTTGNASAAPTSCGPSNAPAATTSSLLPLGPNDVSPPPPNPLGPNTTVTPATPPVAPSRQANVAAQSTGSAVALDANCSTGQLAYTGSGMRRSVLLAAILLTLGLLLYLLGSRLRHDESR